MPSREWRWAPNALAIVGLVATASVLRAEPVPQRIASLNLAADEILVEIVPIDHLVAVTAASDEIASSNIVGRVPAEVARFRRGDMERLIALRPDLVIVSEYTDADFQRLLERSGLRTYRMEGLHDLPGIRRAILGLGRAVGAEAQARRLVAEYDRRLVDLARRLAGLPRPRVLYWSNPFTAGADTAIGALIECGGGSNVAAQIGVTGVVPLGAERAFLSDPDIVLVGVTTDETAIAQHPLLGTLRAVRTHHVVTIPSRYLSTLSQHVADACWVMAHALHPGHVLSRPRSSRSATGRDTPQTSAKSCFRRRTDCGNTTAGASPP